MSLLCLIHQECCLLLRCAQKQVFLLPPQNFVCECSATNRFPQKQVLARQPCPANHLTARWYGDASPSSSPVAKGGRYRFSNSVDLRSSGSKTDVSRCT